MVLLICTRDLAGDVAAIRDESPAAQLPQPLAHDEAL